MGKVEKILKCSLDSIPSPSPSVKIQSMGGKVCLRCKQTFENKKFVDTIQQCFAILPQVNFPANNLNLRRWRWWDQIQTIFLNLFHFWLIFFIFQNTYLKIVQIQGKQVCQSSFFTHNKLDSGSCHQFMPMSVPNSWILK